MHVNNVVRLTNIKFRPLVLYYTHTSEDTTRLQHLFEIITCNYIDATTLIWSMMSWYRFGKPLSSILHLYY